MDVLFILRTGYHLKIYNSLLYVLVRNLFVIDFKVITRTSIELGHPCFSWLYSLIIIITEYQSNTCMSMH